MNVFFTFCFDINKINRHVLIKSAKGLINSFNYFNNDYILYIYTNISELSEHIDDSHVKIIPYNLNNVKCVYNNAWFDLSFHKLFLAKELLETESSIIWIDLDTIVCRNIDHLSKYINFFIMQGSLDTRPFRITNGMSVPHNIYIQGNIWKLDKDLLNKIFHLLSTIKTYIEYDSQGLFNYAYHFTLLKNYSKLNNKNTNKPFV
jgi:lipopolysaccharide biosynthesis glycosyltransferase